MAHRFRQFEVEPHRLSHDMKPELEQFATKRVEPAADASTQLREPGHIQDYYAFAANVREVRNHEPAPGFGPQARPRAGVISPVQIDH